MDIIINRLMSIYGVQTRVELMDCLQGAGKVSDNAITIEECDQSDLLRAYNQATPLS